MTYQCPICKINLILHPKKSYNNDYMDYGCPNDIDDHSYSHRIRNNIITQIKVRLLDDNDNKIYFKVYYDANRSEIWTKSNDNENRIRIDQLISVNFNDVPKLKQKIKSYFLFS